MDLELELNELKKEMKILKEYSILQQGMIESMMKMLMEKDLFDNSILESEVFHIHKDVKINEDELNMLKRSLGLL